MDHDPFYCDNCLEKLEREERRVYDRAFFDDDELELAFVGEMCTRCGAQADWAIPARVVDGS